VRNGPPYPLGEKTLSKEYNERTNIQGKKVSLNEQKKSWLNQALSKRSEKILKESLNTKIFDVKIPGVDKAIGDVTIFQESEDSVNIAWLGINNKYRGHGYASDTMDSIIDYVKKNGYKQMTLEVPGNSPDARHIYEKKGFKSLGSISDEDDVWGGLTAMRLDL